MQQNSAFSAARQSKVFLIILAFSLQVHITVSSLVGSCKFSKILDLAVSL